MKRPVYSFCYGVKNRTNVINDFDGVDSCSRKLNYKPQSNIKLTPFLNSLESVKKSFNSKDEFEVIIVDFQSDDTDYIWLNELDINYKIINTDGFFNRGKALNLGSDASTGDNIFTMDVDMIISKELIEQCDVILESKKAFFPICFSYKTPEHTDGWWRDTGFGMMVVNSEYWKSNNLKWLEKDSWGLEDSDIYNKLKSVSSRERGIEFYHQWHSNDPEFKLSNYKNKRMN